MPAAAPAVAETPAAEPAFQDQPNAEFQAMIDARDSKMRKKRSRQSLFITAMVLACLGSAGGWLTLTDAGKQKIAALKTSMQESGRDLKTIGTITKQYDKQLEKIAVHGDQITDATKAMGIDPSKVDNTKDPGMEEEMRQLSGEGARSTGDRNRDLQSKFGMVQKLAQKNGVGPSPNLGDKKADGEAKPAAQ
ncbi:hypothetical protein [Luteolibacter sp. LG18]|uniref:hypothetical protein n=1 Tax=Luteolibacter sp. LG18 TaxID=2819286 RepID=UPI0030C77509